LTARQNSAEVSADWSAMSSMKSPASMTAAAAWLPGRTPVTTDDGPDKLERIRDKASPSGREIDLETSPGGVSVFRYDQPAATAMPKSIRS